MKLLVITQKIDLDDDIKGFFHQWAQKLANKADFVSIICLEKGRYSLPDNVRIFSLGKEKFNSRIRYVLNFYKYIWNLRNDYDVVFVHMNPIYVVMGGILWEFMNKKIFLWYNHRYGNFIVRLAANIADKVFHTSSFAFATRFENSAIMPVGVDTSTFSKNNNANKQKNSILCLGRISPVKKIQVLIKFTLNIVGEAEKGEEVYFKEIKELAKELEVKNKIKFLGKVPNYKTPELYNQSEIFVNLTPSGSFDKTIIEAMACEAVPVLCNESLKGFLPNFLIFREDSVEDLKEKIVYLFNMETEAKNKLGKSLRSLAIEHHGLDSLVAKLSEIFKGYLRG
jgi:glycosyltransferase involved in cell wall biosynthesis